MASIQNLKKDINNVLGDIIDKCYTWVKLNPKADTAAAEAIMDEAIVTFDSLIDMVNVKDVENKKAHFKAIGTSLEEKAKQLVEKTNKL